MADTSFLTWPFFEERHRAHAAGLEAWCAGHLPVDHGDVDGACKGLVAALGAGGWLRPTGAGAGEALDVRTLCLTREILARHDEEYMPAEVIDALEAQGVYRQSSATPES